METYGSDGRRRAGSTIARFQTNPTSKIAGPGASAVKYDLLTALLVTAACEDGSKARLALRLALVITARFNWRLGLFNVGQKELARMWGVTERTAKRDISLMRSLGWISVEKPAARGRVAQHRIEFATLMIETQKHWQAVGPDFEERMTGTPDPQTEATNVVPLRVAAAPLPQEDGTLWSSIAQTLQTQDPATYAAWFCQLTVSDIIEDRWVFVAPSAFTANYIRTHLMDRLLAAVSAEDRMIRRVDILTA